MPKPKIPFRKHKLTPIQRDTHTPAKDKAEGVSIAARGYWIGAGYTPAELEFIRAVEQWQKRHKTKFLASIAYLRIAQSLGYTRPETTTPPRPDDG